MGTLVEKIYFNRQKEDNWDIVEKAKSKGILDLSCIAYLGYEVEMEVEILETGETKILTINGVDVSSLNIPV